GKSPFIVRLTGLARRPDRWVFDQLPPQRLPAGPVGVDPEQGLVRAGDQTAPLAALGQFDGQGVMVKEYGRPDQLTLLVDLPRGEGWLVGPELADSVFIRLWFFGRAPVGSFLQVEREGLDWALWRVGG
nr:hypothetical protein [Magnetococcales bacterium]